jgi:hypothetical protein
VTCSCVWWTAASAGGLVLHGPQAGLCVDRRGEAHGLGVSLERVGVGCRRVPARDHRLLGLQPLLYVGVVVDAPGCAQRPHRRPLTIFAVVGAGHAQQRRSVAYLDVAADDVGELAQDLADVVAGERSLQHVDAVQAVPGGVQPRRRHRQLPDPRQCLLGRAGDVLVVEVEPEDRRLGDGLQVATRAADRTDAVVGGVALDVPRLAELEYLLEIARAHVACAAGTLVVGQRADPQVAHCAAQQEVDEVARGVLHASPDLAFRTRMHREEFRIRRREDRRRRR